ncbi:MAG: 3'-5' exonuclease, partial [Oleibacter sp.]|nr:3'-5' exonuclease [Thalassolituus sp.]
FQDTDSIQYRIFNTLYPPTDVKAHSASEHSSSEHSSSEPLGYGLIMIGDPKQAIYAFRGADIFTYMSARDQIPDDRCFTLDTNYRSHPTLVSATNALWKMHPHPFVFKDHIAFHPVNAGKAADDSAPIWPSADLSSALSSPLQIWYDEAFSDESPDDAYARIADECAEQIEAVLSGAAVFPATTAKAQSQKKSNKTQDGKPLLAGDMAVLVYSRKQAAWIRNALTARNIGSVFLTRDSVFQTQQASDLLVLLEAVEQPANESMVRRALATPTWGGNASDLALMHIDEVLWEQQLNHLQRYQHTWQRRGIMAMLMQWLDDDQRAVRLRSEPDGERILTNLLHLGEMLQGHSRKVRGHQALIRWLQEHISDEQLAQEEAQLRLETDDKLVTIVTIHKSKGLEYPLVFLPYLWADKAERFAQDKEVIYYDGQRVIRDLSASDDSKALQNRDILAEKMRLLYVALTRAKYGCFLWISNAGSGKKKTPLWLQSALGYLLSKQSDGSEVSLATLSIPDVYVGPRPSWQNHNQARLDFAPEPVSANVFSSSRYGQLRDHWRVGSYSQLAMHGQHQFEQGDAGAQVVDWEVAGERESSRGALTTETTDDMPQLRPLALRFPKGANPGTCLHAIFEDWDFVDTEQLRTIVHMRLTLHGINGVEVEEVVAWFQSMVHQPLPLFVAGENSNTKPSIQLRDLTKASRLDEMEFYLPVGHLTAGDVESLLGNLNQADYEQDNIGASARFQFEPLTGYLKGFIDLIFEWQGRYYVLDYKSNYLGERAEDYYPDALRQSMVEHKYDLQSWIYMVALDRLLAQRLPNYDPQQHLGGSVYMYLRGIALHSAGDGFENHTDNTSESPACGVCFTPLDVDALQHWRNALLGESYVAQISEQDKNDRKDKKAIINKKEKGADA